MRAIDSRGKNALHHLLEARRRLLYDHTMLLKISNAFKQVLEQCPELANQPNHQGLYLLHVAFQHLRHPPPQELRNRYSAVPEIDELLMAGVDPLTRDPRGNTMLHYLAAARLGDVFHADDQRRWLRQFIEQGANVNARNYAAQSALDILLVDMKDSEKRDSKIRSAADKGRDAEEVILEVLDVFDKAGVRWADPVPRRQTLLHVAAKQDLGKRGMSIIKFALGKGVNPNRRDWDDKTALDRARKTRAAVQFFPSDAIVNLLKDVTQER